MRNSMFYDGQTPLDLAIVIPTFDESENVEKLLELLWNTLGNLNFEIIFVDDSSPDRTADRVRSIALYSPRVRCVQRVGRRGLSSACIEGMMATAAPIVAVIDGDMQHDEELLPQMLMLLLDENLDVVVGSRYMDGGGFGDWNWRRRRASDLATWIAVKLTRVQLTDPMSGFFMMRTKTLRRLAHNLSGIGFKILLDIFASSSTPLRFQEIPYKFRNRGYGESKLDSRVLLEFMELLIDKTLGRFLPPKFIMFGMVGSLGVAVHMGVLTVFFQSAGTTFQTAQIIATGVAMTFNFFLNNFFTYHDRRLSGWGLVSGWLSFCAVSSVGAMANVGVAVYLFRSLDTIWLLSAIAGVTVGVVWNYVVTSFFTWKRMST